MHTLISREQFMRIFAMQNAMNVIATGDTNWAEAELPWDIAILREAAEAFDHLGWEWWKKTNPNIEQAKMEIIDIVHFAVSGVFTHGVTAEQAWEKYEESLTEMDPMTAAQVSQWGVFDFLREVIVTGIVRNYGFSFYLALRAANTLGMTYDEVFQAYVAKNILNRFRKANGYKEGTYIKIWDGREDNEHLTDFLKVTDPAHPDYETLIETHLTALYANVKAAAVAH